MHVSNNINCHVEYHYKIMSLVLVTKPGVTVNFSFEVMHCSILLTLLAYRKRLRDCKESWLRASEPVKFKEMN